MATDGDSTEDEHISVREDGETVIWWDGRWWSRQELRALDAVLVSERDQALAARADMIEHEPLPWLLELFDRLDLDD